MPQIQLPAECISCIISHLDGDLTTLFRLLTVNSTFFRATLPVLYRDPYRTLEHREKKRVHRQNGYFSSIYNYDCTKRLLYLLLLSCRQGDDLVPFLNVDWDEPLSPFVSDQPLMACYVDYLGDLNFDRWTQTLKLFLLEFDTQMEQHAFRLFTLLFLNHHKERVEKLSIPITHIEPYMELLPQLRNLQQVRFYEDELEQPPEEPAARPAAAAEPEAVPAVNNNEEEPQAVADVQDVIVDAPVVEVDAIPAVQDIQPTVDPIEVLIADPTPEPEADPITEPIVPEPADTPTTEAPTTEAPTVESPTVEPTMVEQPIEVADERAIVDTATEFVRESVTVEDTLDAILANIIAIDTDSVALGTALAPAEVEETPVEVAYRESLAMYVAYIAQVPMSVPVEEDTFEEVSDGFMAIDTDYTLPEPIVQNVGEVEAEVVVAVDAAAVATEEEEVSVAEVVTATATVTLGPDLAGVVPEEVGEGAQAAAPIHDDNIYEIESEVMLRMFTESTRFRNTDTSGYDPEEAMAYILALVGDPEDVFEPEAAMADILLLLGNPEGHEQLWETPVLESEEAEEEEVEEVAAVEEVPQEQQEQQPPAEEQQPPAEEQQPPAEEQQPPAEEEIPEPEPAQPARPVFDPTPDGVKFLQAHAELFGPGLGRVGPGIVEIEPPYSWIRPSESENTSYGSRYVELLKAQSNPTIIQFHNWERFRHYLKDVPVESVKRLRYFYEEWPETEWDQVELLKRCRSLEKFSSKIYDPTIFKFAIEEQTDREIYQELCKSGVAGASTSLGGGRSHGGHYGPGEDPVPLRKVHLKSYSDGFLHPVLQDICTAFKSSLESITCRLYSADSALLLSQFCDMPQLTMLDLRHDCSNALTNDASFLRGCPSLKTLRLRDGNMDQTLTIQTPLALYEPWHLPCLEELVLVGTACDLFNYETLAHSPQLQSLQLECVVPDMGVHIVSEMYQEHLALPAWNWTWKLPSLHTLFLKGRPAHLFRPCLVLGCPKLTNIHLDVLQVSRSVTTIRDALLSTTTTPPTFQSPVRNLTLKGRWFMNESATTVRDFFQTYFSSLTHLKFESTTFYDTCSTLDGLYTIPTLRKVFLCRQHVSKYDAWKLGLEQCLIRSPFEWERKTRHISFREELKRLRAVEKQKWTEAEEKELQVKALIAEVEAEAAKAKAKAAGTPVPSSVDHRSELSADNKPAEPTSTTTDRVRCQSVDSAIALEEEQAQVADQVKIALEEEERDLFESLRCVYVLNNKRFHREADTPQTVLPL
ncbi:hypothetical protein BGZ96_009529 [Linnemannia gamsii]|uniref:F-box domain-containing protein n=1 Tax=Linnemannia gamsii TaxID=64522 RepID=A0ABQ7JX63_9FUNG|nr:hypothetical protein BGZ96_009529 [Linnemannia gamsii]